MAEARKKWVAPTIEEVAFEAEEDVLATCYTASMSSRTRESNNCRSGRCATYP